MIQFKKQKFFKNYDDFIVVVHLIEDFSAIKNIALKNIILDMTALVFNK